MFKIATLEYHIPSTDVANLELDNESTLLDFDIVVINTHNFLRQYLAVRYGASAQLKTIILRRGNELDSLLKNGKVVFVFLYPIEGVINNFSNYDLLIPISIPLSTTLAVITPGSGTEIKLKKESHIFAPYFKEFKDKLTYKVYFNFNSSNNMDEQFLVNRTDNVVGLMKRCEEGVIVFLPPPPKGTTPETFIDVLIKCSQSILSKNVVSKPPDWAMEFNIPQEKEKNIEIEGVDAKISSLEKTKQELEQKKDSISQYRRLLYEQGKPLEDIVIKSFQLLGCQAERFQKEHMEHDLVINTPEGISAVAEIEGKDKSAIDKSKFMQLSTVVDEYFKEKSVYPEGVLIGNHSRLLHPEKRKEAFTNHVLIGAKSRGFILLSTVDLFKAITEILENPEDDALKKQCRETIFNSKGKEVKFSFSTVETVV